MNSGSSSKVPKLEITSSSIVSDKLVQVCMRVSSCFGDTFPRLVSGHGSQVKDLDGDELDGRDEGI